MSLLLSWLVFPVVALLVFWGCGLLAGWAAGHRPGFGLLLGLGLCVVIVVASLTVQSGLTAPLTVPLVVVLALAGFVLERRDLRPAVDGWALAAVGGVFCVFAAPVVLSGDPTFAGYTILGDTAIHFLVSDHLLGEGSDLSGVPPSEYRTAMEAYFEAASYPVGAQLAAAVLRALVGTDIAWVFQPFLALLAALTAAALWHLVREWVPGRPLRALVVFVAAQPALVYAYALQGSVKELAAIWVLALVAALLVDWKATCRDGVRRAIPLALATGAALNVLSLSILPWLAPLLLIALVLAWNARLRGGALARAVGLFVLVAGVLAVPVLRVARSFVSSTTDTVTAQQEFGNLLRPLNPLQGAGIWLTGDFRLPLAGDDLLWTYALLGVAALALLATLVWVIQEGRWLVAALAASIAVGTLYVIDRGSPWADAKALVIAAPMLLLAVMLGAAAVARRLPVLGWAMGLAIGAGVLVSNALAYNAVVLAPHERLSELGDLGERFAGRGPATTLEADEFTKHFLRQTAPSGSPAQRDVDDVPLAELQSRPLIIRRRTPTASRPPANFRLAERTADYEVWERTGSPQVLRHVPLGGGESPLFTPSCADLEAIAREARKAGGRLAFAERPAPVVFRTSAVPSRPPGWLPDPNEPEALVTVGPGAVRGTIDVPRAARYRVWLEGTFGRQVDVLIDGRPVGRARDRANHRGQNENLGTVRLGAGRHRIAIVRAGGSPRPGSGGVGRRVGRLWLTETPDDARIGVLAPAQVGSLCGRPLDWVEIVR